MLRPANILLPIAVMLCALLVRGEWIDCDNSHRRYEYSGDIEYGGRDHSDNCTWIIKTMSEESVWLAVYVNESSMKTKSGKCNAYVYLKDGGFKLCSIDAPRCFISYTTHSKCTRKEIEAGATEYFGSNCSGTTWKMDDVLPSSIKLQPTNIGEKHMKLRYKFFNCSGSIATTKSTTSSSMTQASIHEERHDTEPQLQTFYAPFIAVTVILIIFVLLALIGILFVLRKRKHKPVYDDVSPFNQHPNQVYQEKTYATAEETPENNTYSEIKQRQQAHSSGSGMGEMVVNVLYGKTG